MAAGPGLASLIPAAMTLLGIARIMQARRVRKKARRQAEPEDGKESVEAAAKARRAATMETERRMAAYLASRDQG